MTEFEVVGAFQTYLEQTELSNNDFKEFWQTTWKPITQKCLTVAKNSFVLRKAFEMFRAKLVAHKFANNKCVWSEIFVDKAEVQILQALCHHVGLEQEEFLHLGLHFHRNRCRKMYRGAEKCIRVL